MNLFYIKVIITRLYKEMNASSQSRSGMGSDSEQVGTQNRMKTSSTY